jgi:DNA polymerase elongation subunit (family B)
MLKDERYIEHVKSDVDSTYGLFEIYYNTSTAVSNLLNIPLGNLIEGSSTYPNKIFSGRELHKKRIVPFETNLSRYKKIAPDIITLNAKDKETINIQAALIKCYKEGYHPYVYSVDYRSFYPSTMKTFNISPESVKFIDFKPKTDGVQPIFKRHKGFLEVEIPDENLGYNAHFYIDQSKNGHIKEKFDQFFDLRAKYKQDIKKAKTEMESKRIEANSNAIKVVMNCFSSDTEVYTTTGIKNIKDCELGDLIYTVNLKTQKIEISPVIEKVKGYSEKIYKIHSRNKEFLATGNHHFPVKTENGYELKQLIDIKKDKYYELISHKPIDGEIKNYFSLFDYVDEDEYMYFIPSEKSCHRHEITKNKTIFEKIYKGKYYFVKKKNIKDPELFELKYKGKLYLKSFSKSSLSAWKYNMDDFMELLGWYISEGSLKYNPSKRYENSISYRGECYSVAISQKLFKQEIKDLLLRMNLKHNITIRKDGLNHYVICNKYIYKVFLELGGESSYYKHIDKKLFKLDYTHLQHLHKTLYMGDGDNSNTNRYSTVSKQLANDYAKLLLHIGKIFKIIYDNNDGIYRIFSNRESNNISTTETIQEIDWNDNVYCITVQDNHTILAGRNGKFNWTGQTTYGFEGSGFSYYGDLACAIAITGFARWLITYAINSNIDSVVYSHTDSIYFNEKVDYELLNKKTAELIKNTTGFDSFIEFEEQDSKSGFFYKAGNYILKKQNGKLLYHGVSMKSSKQVRFFSKLTKDFGTAILEERPRNELIEMAKRYYTFSDLSLDDFLQTTNIKRLAPGENAEDLMNSAYYSNPNAMQPALMSRMKNLYNKELMPGDTIDYYKVKYDYKLKYDSVNIVKLRELLNHKNNIIYRIMLGDIDKKNDSALLNDINKLFADKNIISYIKIDANLIQQEIYREIYNKQKITIRKIETICILNRIIFDIVFKEAILTPFVLGGFVLSYEVNSKDELDLEYYRESLVKKLKIFKMDPYSLEISDNIGLDEWGEKVKAAPKKRIVEELSIEERIAEARKAVNI